MVNGYDLPIEEFMAKVRRAFAKGWSQLDSVTWEAPKKSFQLYTTAQYVGVNGGGLTGHDLNVFIDIANELGCALYDPPGRQAVWDIGRRRTWAAMLVLRGVAVRCSGPGR